MKILCVGPGAMGCLFAALLKKAGNQVALLDYREDRAKQLSREGIRVQGVTGSFHEIIPVITEPEMKGVELVLVCVKARNTREVAQLLAERVGPGTLVASLQNGVGNIETLSTLLGEDLVLGGITSEGATVLGPGHVLHAGKGQTFIGPVKGNPMALRDVASTFNSAGLETKISMNVHGLIWGKLLVNVGINALAAITRVRNGVLAELEETRALMKLAVDEAMKVAKAKDVKLPYDDPFTQVLKVCEATAGNVASMLQDVINKRFTEVDFINGAIVKEGTVLGIPTPMNSILTGLVKTIEKTYGQTVI